MVLCCVATWASVSPPARAFTVKSGFTPGCHETITWRAFRDFLFYMPAAGVPVSNGTTWRELVRFLLEEGPFATNESLTDAQKFFLVSLIVGVRAPDTDGHSITNLGKLRQLHSDPAAEGQYAHALRGTKDDGPEGNIQAIEGIRAKIADLLRQAEEYTVKPADEQVILGRFYVDFYGEVDVEVWAPMYFIGQAAHALQDSFAHTIRSDAHGLRKIAHVMNYVEAIGTDYDETINGLAHSDSMDNCLVDTDDTVAAAEEATIDLFYTARAMWAGSEPDAVEQLLDKWVTLEPGCTPENDFCDNGRWVDVVRKEQTEAYFKSIISCRAGSQEKGGVVWPLAMVLAILIIAGRSSRSRGCG